MTSLSDSLKHNEIGDILYKDLDSNIRYLKDIRVVREYKYPSISKRADFAIFFKDEIYAIIEIKTNLKNSRQKQDGIQLLKLGHEALAVRYGILTDGSTFELYDWWKKTDDPISTNPKLKIVLDQLFQNINFKFSPDIKSKKERETEENKEYIDQLCEVFNNLFKDLSLSIQPSDVKVEGNRIYLSEIVEMTLFNKLFPALKESRLCRFTSLASIFSTIQNTSYRMCATEGMNDTEDGMFLWNTIYDKMIKRALSNQSETVYILSCSPIEKVNDLTMWRLYANDTKGVCLEFNTDQYRADMGFYLRKIRYEGDIVNPFNTDIIGILRQLASYNQGGRGPIFVFNYWDLWSAFVKSKAYKVEEEIRLAYIPSQATIDPDAAGWMLTSSNQIASQYVDFKVKKHFKFPLQLEKVWLGVSCPEKEVNVVQLQKMMDKTSKFRGVNVDLSEIENYRPSKS